MPKQDKEGGIIPSFDSRRFSFKTEQRGGKFCRPAAYFFLGPRALITSGKPALWICFFKAQTE